MSVRMYNLGSQLESAEFAKGKREGDALRTLRERDAANARAAELRNIPAFSDVNFERPAQASEQAQPQAQTAPTGGGTAYVGRPQGKTRDHSIEISEASKRLLASRGPAQLDKLSAMDKLMLQKGTLSQPDAANIARMDARNPQTGGNTDAIRKQMQAWQSEDSARQRGKAPVQSSLEYRQGLRLLTEFAT